MLLQALSYLVSAWFSFRFILSHNQNAGIKAAFPQFVHGLLRILFAGEP